MEKWRFGDLYYGIGTLINIDPWLTPKCDVQPVDEKGW